MRFDRMIRRDMEVLVSRNGTEAVNCCLWHLEILGVYYNKLYHKLIRPGEAVRGNLVAAWPWIDSEYGFPMEFHDEPSSLRNRFNTGLRLAEYLGKELDGK